MCSNIVFLNAREFKSLLFVTLDVEYSCVGNIGAFLL